MNRENTKLISVLHSWAEHLSERFKAGHLLFVYNGEVLSDPIWNIQNDIISIKVGDYNVILWNKENGETPEDALESIYSKVKIYREDTTGAEYVTKFRPGEITSKHVLKELILTREGIDPASPTDLGKNRAWRYEHGGWDYERHIKKRK